MKQFVVCCVLLLLCFPVFSQTDDPKPTVDLVFGTSDRDGEAGEDPAPDAMAGVNVNIPIAAHWDLSIAIDRTSLGDSPTGHIYSYGIPFSLQGVMFDRTRRGNLRVGVGAIPRFSEGNEAMVEVETESGTEEIMQDLDETTFDWFVHLEGRLWFNSDRTFGGFCKATRREPWDNDLGANASVDYACGVTVPSP